jgi:UDP-N-acetyl-D-mannosaminuronic acid dehydrogenase
MENKDKFDVCVVGGLGHVGLPLAIALADQGKKVVAYDINQEAVENVGRGTMPFIEHGSESVLKNVVKNKSFCTSSDKSVISQSHFVIIVIGTPVDEHLNPGYRIFIHFFNEIMEFLNDDQHIILRSTVYPGTTVNIRRYLLSKGRQTRISFCPERIAQAKAMKELYTLPQIISSFDPVSAVEAGELFSLLTKEIIYLEPLEAELAKLFTNTWRYIQFATSNQFYQLATEKGADFYKIYDAITYNYPRAAAFPKAGFAAGPCLFKDTMQLAAFSNNTFFLGHSAMMINEGLPSFVVEELKKEYDLKNITVGILGMAFKANIDDKRESLSYKLKKILEVEAGAVFCSDAYIQDPEFITTDELIAKCDIIILGTPHDEYNALCIHKPTVDVWGFYKICTFGRRESQINSVTIASAME